MNPWAQIDELRLQHAARIQAAVQALADAGFKGQIRDRLGWDGTYWSFPVSGRKEQRRSLEDLVAWCVELKKPRAVAVAEHIAGGKP